MGPLCPQPDNRGTNFVPFRTLPQQLIQGPSLKMAPSRLRASTPAAIALPELLVALAAVAAAASKTVPSMAAPKPEAPPDTLSYSLYPSSPPYCSTPEEMATRSVPPLADVDVESRLVHVTGAFRPLLHFFRRVIFFIDALTSLSHNFVVNFRFLPFFINQPSFAMVPGPPGVTK